MVSLLVGGTSGVFRVDSSGSHAEPDSPPAVAFLAADDKRALALTPQGALWERPHDGGWRLIAATTVPDDVWSFAIDRRIPGRLYIGVSPALLYRSDDGGLSWTACESLKRIPGYESWTFPPPPHVPHVRSIAPDPEVVGGLYIGVEEGGVYRSPDGGETWESINEGLYWDVHTVTPSLRTSDLFATTGTGFHKSSDGGGHWQHITAGIPHRYTVPFLASKAHWGQLFTAAAAGPPPSWRSGVNAAIFRSDDDGERWQQLRGGLPEPFDAMVSALTEDAEGNVYAASGGSVYASKDGGQTWSVLAEGLGGIRAVIEA
jgi:hypothetical protein